MTQSLLVKAFSIAVQHTTAGMPTLAIVDDRGRTYGGAAIDNTQWAQTLLDTVAETYQAGLKGTEKNGFSIQKTQAPDGIKINAVMGVDTQTVYAGLKRSFFSAGQTTRMKVLKQVVEHAYATARNDKQIISV